MERNDLLKFIEEEIPNCFVEANVVINVGKSKVKGVKVTHKPNKAMREMHSKILELLYSKNIEAKENFPFAFAWVSGTSEPVNQALLFHKRKDTGFFPTYWYITDIKDAYESVNIENLADLLSLVFEEEISSSSWKKILEKFCQGKYGGLARGYSTSPLLFNFYASCMIDSLLHVLADHYGCTFCRLGDDIIITSTEPIGRRKRRRFLDIIREAGFTISVKKTRYINLKVQKTFKIFNVMVRNSVYGPTILPTRKTQMKMKGMLFVERSINMDLIDKNELRNKIHGWNGFCKIPEGFSLKNYKKIQEGYKNLKEKIKNEKYFKAQGIW